jgi:hypothetical protein
LLDKKVNKQLVDKKDHFERDKNFQLDSLFASNVEIRQSNPNHKIFVDIRTRKILMVVMTK